MQLVKICLVVLFLLTQLLVTAQYSKHWSPKEIELAHTAKHVDYLNDLEKEVIAFLNLARLFPEKFAEYEIQTNDSLLHWQNKIDSRFRRTLIRTLKRKKSVAALLPNKELTKTADCFAFESCKRGYQGHNRKRCTENYMAECCSYGMNSAKDIVLQLLIDEDVHSLGHRKICLDKRYKLVGVSVAKHRKTEICCVIDFI